MQNLEEQMPLLSRAGKSSYTAVMIGVFSSLLLMSVLPERAVAKERGHPVISSFDMRANGIIYRIFISSPRDTVKEQALPVVYMLDGNATFPMAVKVLEENPQMQALIVGIGYPTDDREEIIAARYYDLTPPTAADLIPPRKNGEAAPRTGGQADFLQFIQTQLRPEIERRFTLDKKAQTLFGHSLGGMFTLHAMFSDRGAFQNYSAADPSIWWNGGSILAEKTRFVKDGETNHSPVKLLIETSGKRAVRAGTETQASEQLKKLRGGPSGKDIYEELSSLPEITAAFHEFTDESHGSMIPLTVKDTLEFVLLGIKPE